MRSSWNFMRRLKPSTRSITDVAWLKLMCGLRDGRTIITKPMLEYLRTPLKNCVGLCPSRYRNSKRFSKTSWSYSSNGIFKEEKPSLDVYLQQILIDCRSKNDGIQKNKVRLQNLRIRGVANQGLLVK